MVIKTFIEKAIEGGYTDFPFVLMRKPDRVFVEDGKICAEKKEGDWKSGAFIKVAEIADEPHRILLDPEAWRAVVGVVETEKEPELGRPDQKFIDDTALAGMHGMIDALAEGKSIEQFLETL